MAEQKQLVRNMQDKMVAGVASGVADYFSLDPLLVRILFVIFALMGGPGLLVYIILWVVMPESEGGQSMAESVVDDMGGE